MALPGDLTTITVTGSYTDGAGNPQGGVVLFTPSSELTDQTGKVVIGTTPIPATVSSTTGTFSQAGLACTDNANLYPESWAWVVTVAVPGAQQTFNTYLPSSLGSTVDISQLAPYLTPAPPPPPLTDTITPGTAAGGDLSGTYPSPQVNQLHLGGGTAGSVTLTGTTPVSVTAPATGVSSLIFLTIQSEAGTAGIPYVVAKTPGSGFTVASTSAADTSVVAWLRIG